MLLTIARDIAAGAGDATTALDAVAKLVQRFDLPAAELQAETLLTAAQRASLSAQRKAVAEAAVGILGSLAEAGEYERAIRVCEAARSAAQNAKELKLAREFSARLADLQRRQKESQAYREALAVIEANPAEPAANLAAGRYLCLVKGDWERGVPMLARGSDADWKAVAGVELRGAASAEAQAAIGDAWWNVAETQQGADRDALRSRAGFWYRQAELKLADALEGLKIKQRLEAISKSGREMPAASPGPAKPQGPPLAIAPFDEKTAKQHQAAWAKHVRVSVVQTNSLGMRFALIPPGEFMMDSTQEEVERLLAEARQQGAPGWYIERVPAEAPQHRVRITRPFCLGLCEVTQAEYERVMGNNPSHFKGDPSRPVEQVSWVEAVDFCRRLGELPKEKGTGTAYRLPTEAEWEYACRAGTSTRYSFGDDDGVFSQHAWCEKNAGGSTQPVGRWKPNAFGLFDIHGNVWEWCADWYDPGYYATSQLEDPVGPTPTPGRVIRGGGWDCLAAGCRSGNRSLLAPSLRDNYLGFRVVFVPADKSSR